jgi:hypothetical protein
MLNKSGMSICISFCFFLGGGELVYVKCTWHILRTEMPTVRLTVVLGYEALLCTETARCNCRVRLFKEVLRCFLALFVV